MNGPTLGWPGPNPPPNRPQSITGGHTSVSRFFRGTPDRRPFVGLGIALALLGVGLIVFSVLPWMTFVNTLSERSGGGELVRSVTGLGDASTSGDIDAVAKASGKSVETIQRSIDKADTALEDNANSPGVWTIVSVPWRSWVPWASHSGQPRPPRLSWCR